MSGRGQKRSGARDVYGREDVPLLTPAEAAEAHPDRIGRGARFVEQLDRQPALLDTKADAIGAGMAGDREAVSLEQIEDRDPALLLDILAALQDGALVEVDGDDPGVGHEPLLAGAACLRHPSSSRT